MSGFSAEWLSLREPYDRGRAQHQRVGRGRRRFHRADRDCGRRSRLRDRLDAARDRAATAPRQTWRLVDNDLGLLAKAAAAGRSPQLTVIAKPVDLVRDLELALDGPLDLITASALLDLVSAEWLDRLIVEAAARRLPVYAALTYDGRAGTEPDDALRYRGSGRLQRAPTHR